MKNLFTAILLPALFILFADVSFSQTPATGTWALTVDSSVIVVGNVTATPASGGTGIGVITHGPAGIVATGWNSTSRDTADYYQFTITPVTGNTFTISSTGFTHSTSTATITAAVYFSTNNGTSFTQLGSDIPVTSTQTPLTDTTHITVNSGVTLIMRIYGWAAASANTKFRIRAMVISGTTAIATSVNNQISGTPSSYGLYQNYPNPFNPTTNIKWQMPNAGMIKIGVYDLSGKEVAVLVNEELIAGTYEVQWNALATMASGIYFYKMTAGDFSETKKLVLLK